MAKVALICLYDNWALGMRTLSNALLSRGHEVSVIHFKLPCRKRLEDFLKHPINYENLHSHESHLEVVLNGYNIDVNMWTHNECELLGDLLEDLRPDIIGLTTRTVYEKYIGQIIDQTKKIGSAVKLVGGFGATMNPTWYLDDVDYVCIGEGEQAIVKMAECVDKGLKDDICHIPNLSYKYSGKVIFNKMEKPDDSEDYFYHPLMDHVPHYVIDNNTVGKTDMFIDYIRKIDPSYSGLSFYYTMAGRGCMWSCAFCSAGQFYDMYGENGVDIKKRRNRKIDNIIAELKLAESHGFTKILFMDSFLVGETCYLLELFDRYKKDIHIPFFAQLFPDHVLKNPVILEKAVEAGMVYTVIGIQSGSERVNEKIFKRKTSRENIIKFSEMLGRYDNLSIDYHIITHNPFETEDDIREGLDLVAMLSKKNAQLVLQKLRPFPGSGIYSMIEQADIKDIDETYHHKVFMLYLIRFLSQDNVFERIYSERDKYSHVDLKRIYAEIRKTDDESAAWVRRGWENYHNAKYDEAMEAFGYAIRMESNNWSALNGRGWAFHQKKRYSEAVMDFNNALKYIPAMERNALQEVWRGLGWVYFCKNDYRVAIDSFNNAMKFCDVSERIVLQDIFRGLGWSYYYKNEFSESIDYFNRAIENIDNNNEDSMRDAVNGLSLLQQRKEVNII